MFFVPLLRRTSAPLLLGKVGFAEWLGFLRVAEFLVAVVAGNELGMRSILFYSVVYALMNIGAFGLVIMLGRKGETDLEIPSYAGLGFRFVDSAGRFFIGELAFDRNVDDPP